MVQWQATMVYLHFFSCRTPPTPPHDYTGLCAPCSSPTWPASLPAFLRVSRIQPLIHVCQICIRRVRAQHAPPSSQGQPSRALVLSSLYTCCWSVLTPPSLSFSCQRLFTSPLILPFPYLHAASTLLSKLLLILQQVCLSLLSEVSHVF